jgi:transposase
MHSRLNAFVNVISLTLSNMFDNPTISFTGDIYRDSQALLIHHGRQATAEHSLRVAAEAKRLALRWNEDPAKAEIAGWLHDISTIIPRNLQLELAESQHYTGLKMQMIDPETGEIVKISVFVATLPASHYLYAEAQLKEDQRNWNNGHVRAFEYFGGVVKIVVPDNLKTGITQPNYYEPGVNLAYQDLAEYYKFAVLPARVKKPKDKGAVENGVQNVERWVIAPLRKRQFFSLHEVQTAIREQLEVLNNRVMQGPGRSRRQEFEAIDQPNLRPLPERPYEYAEWKTATVHMDYHVEFEDHLYSVPFHLIHQKVNIRATEKMVEIFHQGQSVAIHPRNYRKTRYSTQRAHMPENHQFMNEINSDRLLEWAGKIGPHTFTLIQATLQSRNYPEQAYRTCLGILKLARKYRPADMETASQILFESKVFSYKSLEQELIFLQKKTTSQTIEALPVHENIRGAEYYQERCLS